MKNLSQIRVFTVVALCVTGFFTSCHNKTPDNSYQSACEQYPGSCKSVLEAKDFFLFKVGSYWVYEEETSHERDSLYVTEYTNDENGYDFHIRIKSSLTDYEYRYWPSYYPNIDGCSSTEPVYRKCIYINRSKGKFQDNLGDAEVFFINYKKGDILGTVGDMDYCPDSKIIVSDVVSSYTVNNQVYNNVVKMYESCPRHEGYQPINIYYSENVGIIRKELIDSNQVWNLVSYYVIQ